MKEKYEDIKSELISLDTQDIIVTSGSGKTEVWESQD